MRSEAVAPVSLLEQLRALGLPMGGSYRPQSFTSTEDDGSEVTVTRQQWIGWTTDRKKADAAKELGANVTLRTSRDPRFSGWDVSVHEVVGG